MRTRPTELEFCVLGVLWRDGPCSAYAVQGKFAQSSSSHWSASAGSIYPAIRRLEQLGLARSKRLPKDRRGKRLIAATAHGVRELSAWIAELPGWTGKPSMDPTRTRMNFIGALPDMASRQAFIQAAEDNTRAQVPLLEKDLANAAAEGRTAAYLTALGSLCELDGRLRWLAQARKYLESTGAGERPRMEQGKP